MTRQLTLSFSPNARYGREDFQIAPSNRAALDLVDRWPDWPSRVMLLVGPEASGKSHIVSLFSGVTPFDVYDAAISDLHVIAATVEDGSRKSLVVLEDVAKGIDEAGLFHLINATLSAESWLLMTSRSLPVDWGLKLADLASRLRAATPVIIRAPEDSLLEAILAKHFADRQTVVDPSVLKYCIARMERSHAAAYHLSRQLDAAAMSRKSGITRALAADFLTDSMLQPSLPGLEDSGGPDESTNE